MATGMGRAVLLMCGNDDADAENDGAVSARLDDRSVHAPARTTAPSRTSDFASATLAHMLASSKKGLRSRRPVSPVRGARKAGRSCEGRAPGDPVDGKACTCNGRVKMHVVHARNANADYEIDACMQQCGVARRRPPISRSQTVRYHTSSESVF